MRTRLLGTLMLGVLTVTLMLVIASGCGGSSEDDETSVEESTAEKTSEATTKETTAKDKTTAKERTTKEDKASKDKTRKNKAPKEQKAAKEQKKAAKQKTKESKTAKVSSSQQKGGVVSSSSSTRSTETGGSDTSEAANADVYSPKVASGDEPVPSPPPMSQEDPTQEDWRTPSQKAGVNEAGQDVSNTPIIPPEENAARLPCLQAYYDSLPEDQRDPESQRVTAEANTQGVTPYDIVGC